MMPVKWFTDRFNTWRVVTLHEKLTGMLPVNLFCDRSNTRNLLVEKGHKKPSGIEPVRLLLDRSRVVRLGSLLSRFPGTTPTRPEEDKRSVWSEEGSCTREVALMINEFPERSK